MNFKKNKTIIISAGILLALFVFANKTALSAETVTPPTQFQYKMLETLPGFFAAKSSPTLPELILAIYKFGIWTVGIAGLFMLTIGGFMYMASAGNNATVTSAKGIITDALLGIVAAMSAYLIMYVINPDLTSINIAFTKVNVDYVNLPAGGSSGMGVGGCSVMTSGSCSVTNLAANFGADAEKMSKICNRESLGNASLVSKTDLCKDNNSFSVGLFQINMMMSAGSACASGEQMFQGNGSRSTSFNCLDKKTNSQGVTYCAHRDCWVTDVAKYNDCKTKLMNSTVNIQAAKNLYSSGGISPWRTSAKICNVK